MNIKSKEQAKAKAAALRRYLQTQGIELAHRKTLDAIAVIEGHANWCTLEARLPQRSGVKNTGPEQQAPSVAHLVLARLVDGGSSWTTEAQAALARPESMSRAIYEALQRCCEQMELDAAQGRDCTDHFDEVQSELHRLMDASPWMLHPDHGCIRRADFALLEGEAANAAQDAQAGALLSGQEQGSNPVQHWAASLIRIGYGFTTVTVEADSLEEALQMADDQASNEHISEDNYSWGIDTLTVDGTSAQVPKWATMPDSQVADYSNVTRAPGRARYVLSVCREGVGFADWELSAENLSAEEAATKALDCSGDIEVSEKSSNYLIDIVSIESVSSTSGLNG